MTGDHAEKRVARFRAPSRGVECDGVDGSVASDIGREPRRASELRYRLADALATNEVQAERMVRGCVVRIVLDGAAEDALGVQIAMGCPVQIGEVDQGHGEASVDAQSGAELALSLVVPALRRVEQAQIDVRLRAIGIEQ